LLKIVFINWLLLTSSTGVVKNYFQKRAPDDVSLAVVKNTQYIIPSSLFLSYWWRPSLSIWYESVPKT